MNKHYDEVNKNLKRVDFMKKKVSFFQYLLKNRVRTKASQTLAGYVN